MNNVVKLTRHEYELVMLSLQISSSELEKLDNRFCDLISDEIDAIVSRFSEVEDATDDLMFTYAPMTP